MTPPVDQHQELATLIGAFRNTLGRLAERGCQWLPAGPSPRFGVAAPAGAELETNMSAERDVDVGTEQDADVGTEHDVDVGAEHDADQNVDLAPNASALIEGLLNELGSCQRCRLAETRRNIVFGAGSPRADLMFIGEAPGRDEDQQGIPFVGAAGQLLTKMIEAMGLTREGVYIANIIKCRPPENRDPSPDEMDTCEPYLHQQIQIIGPRLIIAMGNFAAKRLLRTEKGITKLRGRFYTYQGVP